METKTELISKLEEALEMLKKDNSLVNEGMEKGVYVEVITGGSGAFCADGIIGRVIDKPKVEPKDFRGMYYDAPGPWIQHINDQTIYHLNQEQFKLKRLSESEVKDALVAYAVKMGIKAGVTIMNRFGNPVLGENARDWFYNKNGLYWDGGRIEIFDNNAGKWAEIISTPEIKAGEYYVVTQNHVHETGKIGKALRPTDSGYWKFEWLLYEYKFDQVTPATEEQIKEFKRKNEVVRIAGLEVRYEGNRVKISMPGEAIYYAKDEIEMFRQVLHKPHAKSILFGCSEQYKVTLQDIDKLLEGFK